MEGENTITERKHFWSKPEKKRHKIYLYGAAHGICDKSEVDSEIEKQIDACLKRSGWGKEFSGWQRIVSYEECLRLKEEGILQRNSIPTGEVELETLDHWTVERAAKTLVG